MKKNIFICIASYLLLLNTVTAQVIVSGVKLPSKLGFAGTLRELNGAGTRVKFFVHAYVAGLYLKEKTHDPKKVVNTDKPMSIRIQIISEILTSDLMVRAIRDGFKASLKGNTDLYKENIDLICDIFSSEPTKLGDVYDIHYTPDVGISANKNGKPFSFSSIKGVHKSNVLASKKPNNKFKSLNYTKNGQEALPGLEFKKVIFGIWFSDNPVDNDLKDAMLGL